MSRNKKTRKISDMMPGKKQDSGQSCGLFCKPSKKVTRFELDMKAREAKKQKKRKGLSSGSRQAELKKDRNNKVDQVKDSRIGSRKKIPLMVEWVNNEKVKEPKTTIVKEAKIMLSPADELAFLEDDPKLNELLDKLDEGISLNARDQRFVDEKLQRIAKLMKELDIEEDQEDNDDELLRSFNKVNINDFKY